MWQHRNLTRGTTGQPVVVHGATIRCPHCGDTGLVLMDYPRNDAWPCPGCTYGELLNNRWTPDPDARGPWDTASASVRESLRWENGVSLAHTETCQAAADSTRHPDGRRCRRPAVPGAGGGLALCDAHRDGGVELSPQARAIAERYVADARANSARWNREAVERADDVA
jgi:hypothetical protein